MYVVKIVSFYVQTCFGLHHVLCMLTIKTVYNTILFIHRTKLECAFKQWECTYLHSFITNDITLTQSGVCKWVEGGSNGTNSASSQRSNTFKQITQLMMFNTNYIISSLFAGTLFSDLCLHLQPYSNCQIPLLVSRCQLFNGFMHFEIKFLSSGLSKCECVFQCQPTALLRVSDSTQGG